MFSGRQCDQDDVSTMPLDVGCHLVQLPETRYLREGRSILARLISKVADNVITQVRMLYHGAIHSVRARSGTDDDELPKILALPVDEFFKLNEEEPAECYGEYGYDPDQPKYETGVGERPVEKGSTHDDQHAQGDELHDREQFVRDVNVTTDAIQGAPVEDENPYRNYNKRS